MDQTRNKKIRRRIMAVSILLMLAVIGFMVWCAMTGHTASYLYNTAMIGFLAVYCFLTDYLEPKLCGELEGLDARRKSAYLRFVGLDAAGYAGLAFFLVSVGSAGSVGIIGVAVYAFTMKPKREARKEYLGEKPRDEEKDQPSRE